MSYSTTRTITRVVAGATAATIALAPAAAMASETPGEPLAPRENYYSVGQSVQIRTSADGVPNSSLTNFRWSVTQLAAEGSGETFTANVPEEGLLLRSLQDFSHPPQENGYATFDIPLENGYGTARSVSLFPPDREDLPVEIKAEFTLDGEPVKAQDIVGKDGVVTATYTVTNKTRQTMTVPITSVTGEEITKEVEADVPLVVEAATFLPDRFAGLNTGLGLGGADGRGNTQVKWIALPFAPLSADGTASFGWSANVRDGVIPDMLIQVLPLYIPENPETPEGPAADDETKEAVAGALPPLDVSSDVAQISAGIADIIGGIEKLSESGSGKDPLKELEGNINAFFTNFGANIEEIATSVDPNNPDGATAQVKELQAIVGDALSTVQEISKSGVLDDIAEAAKILTPERAAILVELAPDIKKLAENAELITDLADAAETIQRLADVGPTFAAAIPGLCFIGELPAEICDNQKVIIDVLKSEELQLAAQILNSTQFQAAAEVIGSPEFQQAAKALETVAPILEDLAAALVVLNKQLPGIITTLEPVLKTLDGVLADLEGALTGLSTNIDIIGKGLSDTNVNLPALDKVVSSIVASVLASPGGQQLTGGFSQLSSGVSGVSNELSTYIGNLVVVLAAAATEVEAAVESGTEAVGAVIETADTLKAEIGGMVMAAHQSPLPYGGDPTQAPPGTNLAGAYEFRMDPANYEEPSTMPRILIAVILLLVGGFVGNWATKRRQPAMAMAGGAAASATAAAAVPEGWAPFHEQNTGSDTQVIDTGQVAEAEEPAGTGDTGADAGDVAGEPADEAGNVPTDDAGAASESGAVAEVEEQTGTDVDGDGDVADEPTT